MSSAASPWQRFNGPSLEGDQSRKTAGSRVWVEAMAWVQIGPAGSGVLTLNGTSVDLSGPDGDGVRARAVELLTEVAAAAGEPIPAVIADRGLEVPVWFCPDGVVRAQQPGTSNDPVTHSSSPSSSDPTATPEPPSLPTRMGWDGVDVDELHSDTASGGGDPADDPSGDGVRQPLGGGTRWASPTPTKRIPLPRTSALVTGGLVTAAMVTTGVLLTSPGQHTVLAGLSGAATPATSPSREGTPVGTAHGSGGSASTEQAWSLLIPGAATAAGDPTAATAVPTGALSAPSQTAAPSTTAEESSPAGAEGNDGDENEAASAALSRATMLAEHRPGTVQAPSSAPATRVRAGTAAPSTPARAAVPTSKESPTAGTTSAVAAPSSTARTSAASTSSYSSGASPSASTPAGTAAASAVPTPSRSASRSSEAPSNQGSSAAAAPESPVSQPTTSADAAALWARIQQLIN